MSSSLKIKEFAHRRDALDETVQAICRELQLAVSRRGSASFGVCGGQTAAQLFPMLSEASIDWNSVTVVLVDDRWVANDSSESNEALVREMLLRGPAAGAKFISLRTNHPSAKEALPTIETQMEQVGTALDALFISMGEDGHIASLFPGGAENLERKKLVVATTAVIPPIERISLSPKALSQAQHCVMPIFGEVKRKVFERALRSSSPMEFPMSHLINNDRCVCEIFLAP